MQNVSSYKCKDASCGVTFFSTKNEFFTSCKECGGAAEFAAYHDIDVSGLLPDSLRAELLREAAYKPVQMFTQIDYFNENTGVTSHDGNDDTFIGITSDLQRSTCMRLLIPVGYTKEDMVRGLSQMLEHVAYHGDSLAEDLLDAYCKSATKQKG